MGITSSKAAKSKWSAMDLASTGLFSIVPETQKDAKEAYSLDAYSSAKMYVDKLQVSRNDPCASLSAQPGLLVATRMPTA